MPSSGRLLRPLDVALVLGLWGLYAALIVPTWGDAYLDFGDGNYLYASRRVLDGAVLYRDILSPQPPIHTLVGVAALWFGEAFLGRDLLGVRLFSLLLRLGTALLAAALVARLAGGGWRACDKRLRCAKVAAALGVLFIPTSFWWARGFQTHPTVAFLVLGGMLMIATGRRAMLVGGGAALGLAHVTSMTVAPFTVLLGAYLLVRRRRWLLPVVLGAAATAGGVALFYEHATGAFLDNVVRNQVGSFPREEMTGQPLWRYVVMKLATQGAKVIEREWAWLVIGSAGLIRGWWEAVRRDDRSAETVAFMGLAWLGSIVFVAKGATADYIFTLGEPWLAVGVGVAVLGATGAIWRAAPEVGGGKCGEGDGEARTRRAALLPAVLVGTGALLTITVLGRDAMIGRPSGLLVVVGVATMAAAVWCWRGIGGWNAAGRRGRAGAVGGALMGIVVAAALVQAGLFAARVVRGEEDELPADKVRRILGVIESTTRPGDAILSPPFYAFLSGRRVAGEYAEIFLWTIKYWNERVLPEHRGRPGAGIAKVEELAALLRARQLPLVILDLAQTGRIPEIADAIAEHYCPLFGEPSHTLNTPLQFFVPRRDGVPCDRMIRQQGALVRFAP